MHDSFTPLHAPLQVKVLDDPDTGKPVVITYSGVVLYAQSCMDPLTTMRFGFLTATYDVPAGSWGMTLYAAGGGTGLAEITADAAGEAARLAGTAPAARMLPVDLRLCGECIVGAASAALPAVASPCALTQAAG